MATLQEYRARRDFERTPEPVGAPKSRAGALRFVVQMHDATRLHYDFRLELGGVLVSWAIPKGPSLDPKEKRLAVRVEDHPLEYGSFEGIIPKGNYGAGTVMVWDEGTFEPAKAPNAGTRAENETLLADELQRGTLHLVLHGKKLRGAFNLFKLKSEKEWLLVKKKDAFATDADVLAQDRSAASQRSLETIAAEAAAKKEVWTKEGRAAPPPAPPPRRREKVKPMLADVADRPFDRPGWWFEIKFDGYRAIAEIEKGAVQLYSRNHIDLTAAYRPVAAALADLGHDAVLDGEVVVLDERGRSRFELLQNYGNTRASSLFYYVFDLLYLDGADLRRLPLRERKQRLQEILPKVPYLRLSEHIEEKGKAFFRACADQGLEGIMAKRAASTYQEGKRSGDWQKIKVRQRQEVVIGGFTLPRGSRQGLGSVVLGVFDDGKLVHVGRAGSGFTDKTLADLLARLEPLVRSSCPFVTKPKTDMPARWVEPVLVCEVEFQEWTSDGVMRFPVYMGLRSDKAATDVVKEPRLPGPDLALAAPPPRTGAAPPPDRPPLTNLTKVFWPEDGYTKGDLLDYYAAVSPHMVPHLVDRPFSMNRHPNGIHGKSFFHKNVSKQPPPPWVATTHIRSEHDGRERTQMLCQNSATLLYLANLGCIEMNPWHSRVTSLGSPDYIIIDLDPHEARFAAAVEVACALHRLLDKHDVPHFSKTSGKRGLHIYIPLGAQYDYDLARQFAEFLALLLHRQTPDISSVIRDPNRRRGKVYIDYLQNRRGQTIVAPYSVRPVVGAPVSTPLKWSEVNKRLDPSRFTIKTAPKRFDNLGDLWAPLLGPGVDLAACLQWLSS